MNFRDFLNSIDQNDPPKGMTKPLKALWYDRKENWKKAHEMIQEESDRDSALVHAYLHRKEPDDWNARYWYRQAGTKPFSGSLESEWESLVKEFLNEQSETDFQAESVTT